MALEQFENPFEKYDSVKALVWVGAGGGAVSYGLSKITDFDLIAEVAAGQPELAGGAFLAAGAVSLADDFGLTDL